jgi:hypothetical protein
MLKLAEKAMQMDRKRGSILTVNRARQTAFAHACESQLKASN